MKLFIDPYRKGDWCETLTNRVFWPIDPRPEDFCIEDIAGGLAKESRFAGQIPIMFTVAQHCNNMTNWAINNCLEWDVVHAMHLHDLSEAYIRDIPRPTKRHLSNYVEIEQAIMAAGLTRWRLPVELPAIVKEIDSRILLTEGLAFGRTVEQWKGFDGLEPLPAEGLDLDEEMDWRVTQLRFMSLHRYICAQRGVEP